MSEPVSALDTYFRWQPKQLLLREAVDTGEATVIGYGGSRGGAKSRGGRDILLSYCFEHPGIRARLLLTFNPGNVDMAYLQRIFIDRLYQEAEVASDYLYVQAYGWDNREWSRTRAITPRSCPAEPGLIPPSVFESDSCTEVAPGRGLPCPAKSTHPVALQAGVNEWMAFIEGFPGFDCLWRPLSGSAPTAVARR